MLNHKVIEVLASLVPSHLRKPKRLTWVYVMSKPLETLKNTFMAKRERDLYLLSHNSQVRNLEKLLETEFDTTGIFISDPTGIENTFLYNRGEGQEPVYVYNDAESQPVHVYNRSEFYPAISFIIWLPSEAVVDLNRLKALVNMFKLAGKSYEVRTYSELYFLQYTGRVCVEKTETFRVTWNGQRCSISLSGYMVSYSDRQCIMRDESYDVKYSDKKCTYEPITYEVSWSNIECVLEDSAEQTLVYYSNRLCVLEAVETYEVVYSDKQCTIEPYDYDVAYTNKVCNVETYDYEVAYSDKQCTLEDTSFKTAWKGKVCTLEEEETKY